MSYVTVQDVRSEGVAESYTDLQIESAIALAQDTIEKILGLYFEKREAQTFKFDGSGHDLLSLPVPPISESSITSVTMDGTVVDPADYEILMNPPRSRLYPKLRFIGQSSSWCSSGGKWNPGKSNIVVVGDFGYVDAAVIDGTTTYKAPLMVQRLTKLLAIWGLTKLTDAGALRAGYLAEEQLGDYRYRLAAGDVTVFGEPSIPILLGLFYRPSMAAV